MAVKKIQHSDGHQQVWVRGRLEDRQTFACALQRGGAGGTVAHRVHRRSIGGAKRRGQLPIGRALPSGAGELQHRRDLHQHTKLTEQIVIRPLGRSGFRMAGLVDDERSRTACMAAAATTPWTPIAGRVLAAIRAEPGHRGDGAACWPRRRKRSIVTAELAGQIPEDRRPTVTTLRGAYCCTTRRSRALVQAWAASDDEP
jgi:hypothetical protein